MVCCSLARLLRRDPILEHEPPPTRLPLAVNALIRTCFGHNNPVRVNRWVLHVHHHAGAQEDDLAEAGPRGAAEREGVEVVCARYFRIAPNRPHVLSRDQQEVPSGPQGVGAAVVLRVALGPEEPPLTHPV
eukprot:CAMPEP_0114110448 /NCGR_PEP_ID=MMETSP0043_2-20121206/1317_1 /TAXON_ID=464988 /ORGANISM="Hemiselmis andersenii, Strain CCMP644" /LENGTH=130 /DNA_ID=CAMNT_0001202397 /DNA_START=415 /DNA_END=803 /DNA_ORIENTATION=-